MEGLSVNNVGCFLNWFLLCPQLNKATLMLSLWVCLYWKEGGISEAIYNLSRADNIMSRKGKISQELADEYVIWLLLLKYRLSAGS